MSIFLLISSFFSFSFVLRKNKRTWWSGVGLLLGKRRRLWANAKLTFGQNLVFTGSLSSKHDTAKKCWFNVGLMLVYCWFNVGPASWMWANIESTISMRRVCCLSFLTTYTNYCDKIDRWLKVRNHILKTLIYVLSVFFLRFMYFRWKTKVMPLVKTSDYLIIAF